jgi:sporulation protein YlmC with PRC-barrel domain
MYKEFKMLRSANELKGYKIIALDGEIGKVYGFYFDDHQWTIRYLVADTGTWLENKLVLISPHSLGKPKWQEKELLVSLTKKQIEESPDIDSDKPVSRQHEIELSNYYQWPNYWAGTSGYIPAYGYIPPVPAPVTIEQEEGDPNLRDIREVTSYSIHAIDGDIGHVEDFIIEDETWKIRYLVIDTRNWLPGGRKVIISLPWIEKIVWHESKVYVNLSRNKIKNSPEYDFSIPLVRKYEEELHKYYEKPEYWE